MGKRITLGGKDFDSLLEAEKFIKESVKKGDVIDISSNNLKFSILKELFSDYSNNDEEKWHIDPNTIEKFKFGAKLNGHEDERTLSENNCFYCIFTNNESRDFSLKKALSAVHKTRSGK